MNQVSKAVPHSQAPRVGMISLGCARNLVDAEVIAGSLRKMGFRLVSAGKRADLCVINTCAFIGSAREESVDAILEALIDAQPRDEDGESDG